MRPKPRGGTGRQPRVTQAKCKRHFGSIVGHRNRQLGGRLLSRGTGSSHTGRWTSRSVLRRPGRRRLRPRWRRMHGNGRRFGKLAVRPRAASMATGLTPFGICIATGSPLPHRRRDLAHVGSVRFCGSQATAPASTHALAAPQARAHTHMRTQHTCAHTCSHVCSQTHTHTHTRQHAHTHAHTHFTHTRARAHSHAHTRTCEDIDARTQHTNARAPLPCH